MKTDRNNLHEYFSTIINSIINALYNANLPIVFKGMAINRIILKNNNAPFIRETEDIDGDWIGEQLPVEEIENQINKALSSLDNIVVKTYRNYGEHISAGFDILQFNRKIGSFDLSIRKNEFYKLYDIDGIKFYGQTLDKTIADKIFVLSTRKIFRRPKDLLDLYCLSSITTINKDVIINILNKSNRLLEEFKPLYNQKDEIQHAYESMFWLENKPPFEEVYDCCINISKLFIKNI